MKRLLLPALLLAALPSLAAPSITYVAVETPADALVGAQVEALVPGGAAYVWADLTLGKSRTRTYLTNDAGDHWTARLPPCHAGSATVALFAEDADGAVVSGGTRSVTFTENTSDTRGLTEQRYPDIYAWPQWPTTSGAAMPGTKQFSSGWFGYGCQKESTTQRYFTLYAAANGDDPDPEAQTRTQYHTGSGGLIKTQAALDGIGTLWLKAKMCTKNVDDERFVPGVLAVDLVQDNGRTGLNKRYRVKKIAEFTVPAPEARNQWHQFRLVIQDLLDDETDWGKSWHLQIRNKTDATNLDGTNNRLYGTDAIDICDIVLAPPVPDVEVHRFEMDYEPGFPNVLDPLTFRVVVSNRWACAPATNITPRLVFRQGVGRSVGAWQERVMTNTLGRTEQGSGTYAITFEPGEIRAGSFEYFFDVSFGGYTPKFRAVKYEGNPFVNFVVNGNFGWDQYPYLIHTNEWAILTDSEHDVNESRSPVYAPSLGDVFSTGYDVYTVNSGIVPGTPAYGYDWDYSAHFDPRELYGVRPQGTGYYYHATVTRSTWTLSFPEATVEIPGAFWFYELLPSDGVRSYRSADEGLTLTVSPWSGSGATGLKETYPMMLTADHTWQTIIRITNAVDVAMAPTSACHYVEGSPVYTPGPYVWLEEAQDPTGVNPPSAGYVKPVRGTAAAPDLERATGFEWDALALDPARREETQPTRVSVNYNGHLLYRVCTTNGAYEVRRATWQDFNDWTADIRYFQVSHGLENQKSFPAEGDTLDGRVVSTDAKAATVNFQKDVAGPDETANPATDSRFLDGVIARNTWMRWDEELVSANDVGTAFMTNGLVRLCTLPSMPGSVETTSESKVPGGRGVFSFKVRVSARDKIAKYWVPGLAWTERNSVYAYVRNATFSTATNAHVSVYACWQDADNNLEARLVQHARYVPASEGGSLASRRRNYLELQLWQTVDGTERLLESVRYPNSSGDDSTGDTYTLAGDAGWVVALQVTTDGRARARLYDGDGFLAKTAASGAQHKVSTDYATPDSSLLAGGTVAVNATDAAADFSVWSLTAAEFEDATTGLNGGDRMYPFASSASSFAAVFKGADGAAGWKSATNRDYWDNRNPWSATTGAGGTEAKNPSVLHRPVPTAYYRVQVYRSDEESTSETVAPVPTNISDWDSAWDVVGGHAADGVRSVSDFGWQTVSVPMHFWDDTFVRILAMADDAGDGTGVKSTGFFDVDEIDCTAWLGQTVRDPEGTTDLSKTWIGTFAMIDWDGAAQTENKKRQWKFERTRANPKKGMAAAPTELPAAYETLAQALVSPLMADGVGDFTFEYVAEGADVPFTVELVNERTGGIVSDGDFQSLVYTARVDVAQSETLSFLRAGFYGRVRVRPLADPDSIGGTLYLRGLRASDYPAVGDTSWEAYNALVSTFGVTEDAYRASVGTARPMWSQVTNGLAKFDVDTDRYRSAVLNSGYDSYTLAATKLSKHAPYVQTAAIETGIGEVGFWYRPAPGETNPGRIRLLAAKSHDTPDAEWIELTAANLNTNWVTDAETGEMRRENPNLARELEMLDTITNVTSTAWSYFNVEFYQHEYNVVRLCATGAGEWNGRDTGAGRVMIDNVIITEPVRSSIDVGQVAFNPDHPLSPGIPLSTEPTTARVTLVNPRRNPQDIEVYLDWYCKSGAKETIERTIVHEEVREEEVYKSDTVLFPDGVERDVWYWDVVTYTNTSRIATATRVPVGLSGQWGHDNWSAVKSGTLLFTNAPGLGPFVFVSTNSIPTDVIGPDEVVQYCVRVQYTGRFSAPVYSETQGRVSGGFWFENPAWYTPIDLNDTFGTTNQPSAHFWTFSVGTNLVMFNEIRASSGDTDDSTQARKQLSYVELLGPEGADVTGWQMRVANVQDGYPVLGEDWWTNTLAAANAPKALFREASNATTNKGWGVYLLGGEEVDDRDQILVPAEADDICVYFSDALVLTRPMGAWVQRVVWSQTSEDDVAQFVNQGYEYIGSIAYRERGSRVTIPTYTRVPDSASDDDWATTWTAGSGAASTITPGGFNQEQEETLRDIFNGEEEVPIPLISQPVITDFDLGSRTFSVTFTVQSTNDVPISAGDFVWRVRSSDAIDDRLGNADYELGVDVAWADVTVDGAAATGIEAAANVPVEVVVSGIPVYDDADTCFYWIVATPTRTAE